MVRSQKHYQHKTNMAKKAKKYVQPKEAGSDNPYKGGDKSKEPKKASKKKPVAKKASKKK